MYFPPVSKFLSIMYLLSKDFCHSYPVIYRFDVKKFTNNIFVFLIDFSLTLLSNNVIVEIFLSFFLTGLCRFLIINHYKYRMDLLLKIYIYENIVLISEMKQLGIWYYPPISPITEPLSFRRFLSFPSFIPRSYSKSLELRLSPEITTSYLPDFVSNFSETRLKCALLPFDILL